MKKLYKIKQYVKGVTDCGSCRQKTASEYGRRGWNYQRSN